MARLLDRPATALSIAEATKASAPPRLQRREAQKNLLIVRCASEWFAIPADAVVHVSAVAKIHALPHRSKKGFRGLTAIAGAIVPVIDLPGLLDLAPAEPSQRRAPRMVQVGEVRASWAFEADDVPGVYALPASAVKALPLTVQHSPNRISCGLVTTTHGPASLVDPVRMADEFMKAIS